MISGELRDTNCLEYLITNQNSDGGWGYQISSPSVVEPTSWALAALLSCRRAPAPAEVCVRARKWLLLVQRPDGSWPAFPGQPQGSWVTSVASQVLHSQGDAESAVNRGMHWVLNERPADGTLWWRVRHALFPPRVARQDNSLYGWNWTPGTASWVEPTAHALIFLRSLPQEFLPSKAPKRRQVAQRMLFDRMCPGGGWNSGNPLVYGVPGVPRVGTTAWALLALREQSERPEVQTSLSWLESTYGSIRGAASLALAHRCLVAYGRGPGPLASALGKLYSHNRFFGSVLTMAWALLALNEEESRNSMAAEEVAGA